MERFTENQAEDYWKTQHRRAGALDREKDPDSLGNVCHAGTPLWFNEYYARYQRQIFEELLSRCAAPASAGRTLRALDVGCGAGRWCRTLAQRGYAVHGIDLQRELIEADRKRYPEMRFDCVSVLEFKPPEPFDLVTTVTVLQHIPFLEQKKAIANIASMVKVGGNVLILENVRDQDIHVFAQSITGWQTLFEEMGFRTVQVRRYDYSPAIRMSGSLVSALGNLARRTGILRKSDGPELPRGTTGTAAEINAAPSSPIRSLLRSAGWLARKAALTIDERIEPLLIRLDSTLPTVHCGFLFEKVASPPSRSTMS